MFKNWLLFLINVWNLRNIIEEKPQESFDYNEKNVRFEFVSWDIFLICKKRKNT